MPESRNIPTDSNMEPLAGIKPGFASWPEITGHDKSSVLALHAQLLFSQWMDPERFRSYQLRQLERMLRFAGKISSHYQPALKFLESIPTGELYAEQLAFIPVLSCGELQKNDQKIIARRRLPNHGRSRMVRIPKPTGSPVKMMMTGLVDAWGQALKLRGLEWNDSDLSLTHVRIHHGSDKHKAGAPRRRSVMPWSGPSHDLSADRPASDLLGELVRMNPGSVQAEPAVLESLADLSVSQGIKPDNLREVHCRSRYLDPGLRKLVEDAWGVPVIHEYFLEEVGVIAQQCAEQGQLHVNSEFVYAEVLDDNNMPCSTGKAGRVVVTPLQNFQTPLIRYDTGSFATWGEPCNCGRTLPVIHPISV